MSLAHEILPRHLSLKLPIFLQQRVEEAYESGFMAAWEGSDGPTLPTARGKRAQEVLSIAAHAGFNAAIRWIAALGGREKASKVMRDSPAMAEQAEATWRALNQHSNTDSAIALIGREPCARCQWIAGCARIGWDCPAFRAYVQREGTRGVRPAQCPDGPIRPAKDCC